MTDDTMNHMALEAVEELAAKHVALKAAHVALTARLAEVEAALGELVRVLDCGETEQAYDDAIRAARALVPRESVAVTGPAAPASVVEGARIKAKLFVRVPHDDGDLEHPDDYELTTEQLAELQREFDAFKKSRREPVAACPHCGRGLDEPVCDCDGGEQGGGLCAIPHEPTCPRAGLA